MSAGDYRKPYNRPEGKELAQWFGKDPEGDRKVAEWYDWIIYEIAARMGVVTRSGEAQMPSDQVASESMLDDFFDEFDRLVLHEEHNS